MGIALISTRETDTGRIYFAIQKKLSIGTEIREFLTFFAAEYFS